jgi:hypothetical protein
VVRQLRQEHLTPSGGVQPFTWLVLADDTPSASSIAR